MTKIAIQFEEEGFYVPLRQCKHLNMVLDKSSTAQAHVWKCADCGHVYGDTRPTVPTLEDRAMAIGAVVLAVAVIAFDIAYAISHWGSL